MRQHTLRILTGLVLTVFFAGHAANAWRVDLIERAEAIAYDTRLRLTMTGSGDPRVVILDIDERSLGEFGRWPWSRDLMARLMDRLFDEYGAALAAFDVVWAEADNSSGMAALDALAAGSLRDSPAFRSAYGIVRPSLDYDGRFAASMKGRPVVLGYYLSSEPGAVRANAIGVPALAPGAVDGRAVPFTTWSGYTGNLPAYAQAAAGAGHINPIVDLDGSVRRVPMLAELDGARYEALSLAIVRALLAAQAADGRPPPVRPGFPADGQGGLEWLDVGPLRIPVDGTGSALVPYSGPRGSFDYVAIADVLSGKAPPERLRGKAVLIGATAPGLMDLRATPVGSVYPGVEIHANLVAGILNGTLKARPGYVVGAEVLILLIAGTALSLLLPKLSMPWATATALGVSALASGMNLVLWSDAGLDLPLASALALVVLLYTMYMAWGYLAESRNRRQIAGLFGQYVPPELVDRMAADPGRYSMEPRDAELTILFSDVRGFTGIAEFLRAEELREYINTYLTEMSDIIRSRHRGTLDKYIGDAIMAFWGAPVEDPAHARHAVLAALDMQRHCADLNARFRARGWPPLHVGVGINSGNVRVGDMGSRVRRAYTVMGDAVNVASRLEGRTKYYGVGILAGEGTRRAVPDIAFREVDRIRVKGRDEALAIYEPLGPESGLTGAAKAELGLWEETLRAWRARRWEQVDANLQKLQCMAPDCELYALYAGRAAEFRRNPPPEAWDGVTAFDEK
ncbi:MAG: CHASE2 domain-containing protein [Betaproteobacteria bacterium]